MNTTPPLNVVIGGGGGIGAAVVDELLARSARLRVVGRRAIPNLPPEIEQVSADVATRDGALAAVAGASVVYMCAQPPYTRWAAEFPALLDAVADAASQAGAKLVFADNLYMYGPVDGPIGADDAQQPTSRKGAVRKALAAGLLARHAEGSLRVAIGRSSDYYGPRGHRSIAGDVLFKAALAGKPYRYPAALDVAHTFHYLPDIASALVALGIDDRADGRAWVIPAAEPLTARALAALVYGAAAQPVRTAVLSKPVARLVGVFIPDVREMVDIWGQFAAPFTVDSSAFDRELGPFVPTPHGAAVAATVAWFSAGRSPAPAAAVIGVSGPHD